VDTVIKWKTRYITDTVYKYTTDTIVKVINDCSKCKHDCPKCPECPDTIKRKTNVVKKGTDINIEFPFDSCTPYDENDPDIIKLIDSLKNYYPDTCIIIEGHTDSLGSDAYNLELSQCRADSVKKILERNGIDGMRITAIGRGECCPRDTNSTPEGRRRNRRIVYFLYPCPIEYNEIGKEVEDSVWEEEAWD
jgi:outer membrane protein OmpA-like peptidoglycan-associated protein